MASLGTSLPELTCLLKRKTRELGGGDAHRGHCHAELSAPSPWSVFHTQGFHSHHAATHAPHIQHSLSELIGGLLTNTNTYQWFFMGNPCKAPRPPPSLSFICFLSSKTYLCLAAELPDPKNDGQKADHHVDSQKQRFGYLDCWALCGSICRSPFCVFCPFCGLLC